MPVIKKTRKAQLVVGFSDADFTCTGTSDGAQILAAINALPATGGRILIRNSATAYDFSAVADRLFVVKSNVTIEAESPGGVTFKASASLFPGGSNAQGQFGILTIGKTQASKISNITIRGIIFDCNNQAKTAAICIDGGSPISAAIGLQNVRLDQVVVKNTGLDSSDAIVAGTYVASGTNSAIGNRGYVDRLTCVDCDFGFGQVKAFYFQGTNITNVRFLRCNITDNNRDGVYINDYGTTPTSSDWIFDNCRFDRNMALTSGSSQAHIRDNTQIGVYNFTVKDCYFGPTLNAATNQDYCLTPYWAANLRITGCFFDRVGDCVSIGASISGSYNKNFPITRFIFNDNVVYQARAVWDPDSTVFGTFKNNIFYEVKDQRVFGSYSRHFPTTIEGNLIYDCHTDNSAYSSNAYHTAAIQTAGDGFVIRNNYIIDDRKLDNPSNALTLTTVVGGALSLRTYYIRYTWANDVGETLGYTEQTQVVAASSLLKTDVGFSAIPPGAKKMNIYVSTTSGSLWTLQTTINLPTKTWVWTEPTTGLVAGAALPSSNTTDTKTKYGIYELTGGATATFANVYADNHFIGIAKANCVFEDSSYTRLRSGNTYDVSGTRGFLEAGPVKRVTTLTAASNVYTPDVALTDENKILSPAADFTIAAPTGTPTDRQTMVITIKSDATGRTPTFNSIYVSSGIATLPVSALPASKTVTLGFTYDSDATKFVLRAADITGY